MLQILKKSVSLPDIPSRVVKAQYENQIWDTEEKSSDLPESLKQQSLLQKILLYQLAIKNILVSYLPNLPLDHHQLFVEISNEIDIDPEICLQKKENGLPEPINREKINYLINKANSRLKKLLNRFSTNASIEWFTPEFVTFLNAGKGRVKNDHEILFPFLVCNHFQTNPTLKKEEQYLVAIIDCETLKSKLIETYVKNVALTLESAVKHQDRVVGASLVIKGRLSRNLLTWFRGSSLIDLSPIPSVEVIYGIPLEPLSTEDYLFTLKQGTKYRLKKRNNEITNPIAENIYKTWQVLRPYVVVDQLINEAASHTEHFASFIHFFWKSFYELKNPNPDVPDFNKISQMNSEELLNIAAEKVKLYKKALEEESKGKNPGKSNKAKKLLEKFNENLIKKVSDRVKRIAGMLSPENNLFYLDWHHIIYDTLKDKSYDEAFDEITFITSDVLNEKNVNAAFYVNRCMLKLDDLSKPHDEMIRIHFSEKPKQSGNSNDYSNRLFNWTLLTIIIVYMQLGSANAQKFITLFIKEIFSYNINKSSYRFFYEFLSHFKKAAHKKQTDKKDHEMVLQFFDPNENKYGAFDHSISFCFMKILEEKLKELSNSKIDSNKSESDDEGFELDSFFDGTADHLNFPSQDNNMDNDTPPQKKTYFNETELTDLLEKTPLFDNISLNDIKALLKKYEKTFDAVELMPSESEDYSRLEKFSEFVTFWNNNPVWKYFHFLNIYKRKYNIVKYIYVITKENNIKVAYEPICGDTSDRPCHSQLANGLGVKAAGELVFQYENSWRLIIINNGSGHYRPPAHLSLLQAKEKILTNIDKGISVNSVRLLNSLKPGMTLASGWDDITDIIHESVINQTESIKIDLNLSELLGAPQEIGSFIVTPEEIKFSINNSNNYYTADLINILLYNIELMNKDVKVYPAVNPDQINDLANKVSSQKERFVFIPLNIAFDEKEPKHKNHWIAVVIDKEQELVLYIDPAAKTVIPPQVIIDFKVSFR